MKSNNFNRLLELCNIDEKNVVKVLNGVATPDYLGDLPINNKFSLLGVNIKNSAQFYISCSKYFKIMKDSDYLVRLDIYNNAYLSIIGSKNILDNLIKKEVRHIVINYLIPFDEFIKNKKFNYIRKDEKFEEALFKFVGSSIKHRITFGYKSKYYCGLDEYLRKNLEDTDFYVKALLNLSL